MISTFIGGSTVQDTVGQRIPVVERRFLWPFCLVTTLFLSWALAASLNDVLIRHFQSALDLTRGQSSLIQFAFYIGYFCAALPAGFVIRRSGYKSGILVGLVLYAVGALAFYPAAQARSYADFLAAAYVLGAVAGPAIGGLLILSNVDHTRAELKELSPAAAEAFRSAAAAAVQTPYLCIGIAVSILALAVALTRLPEVRRSPAAGVSRSLFK